MAAINVDKLPLKELIDLENRVKKAIVTAREREKTEALQELKAVAAKRGLSLNDIIGGARSSKGSKVAVKFRNPDNHEDTWTGRGRQPKWLVAALKKGSKLTDFAL